MKASCFIIDIFIEKSILCLCCIGKENEKDRATAFSNLLVIDHDAIEKEYLYQPSKFQTRSSRR